MKKSFQGVDWIKMAQNRDEDKAVVKSTGASDNISIFLLLTVISNQKISTVQIRIIWSAENCPLVRLAVA